MNMWTSSGLEINSNCIVSFYQRGLSRAIVLLFWKISPPYTKSILQQAQGFYLVSCTSSDMPCALCLCLQNPAHLILILLISVIKFDITYNLISGHQGVKNMLVFQVAWPLLILFYKSLSQYGGVPFIEFMKVYVLCGQWTVSLFA